MLLSCSFFDCLMNELLIDYANIYPKAGIMQYKVLKINIILTNKN